MKRYAIFRANNPVVLGKHCCFRAWIRAVRIVSGDVAQRASGVGQHAPISVTYITLSQHLLCATM